MKKLKIWFLFLFILVFGFHLKAQDIFYLNEPNFFIGFVSSDVNLIVLNKVSKQIITNKEIMENKEFSFQIKYKFDSIGNCILENYLIDGVIVSEERKNELLDKKFGYYHTKINKSRNKKSKEEKIDSSLYMVNKWDIITDSLGNITCSSFPYPILEDTLKINYEYNYKLKTGKSSMTYNGIKYLRSTFTLNSNNRIEIENYYLLKYNTTSYKELQETLPRLSYGFEYFENGLLKTLILKTSATYIQQTFEYEYK